MSRRRAFCYNGAMKNTICAASASVAVLVSAAAGAASLKEAYAPYFKVGVALSGRVFSRPGSPEAALAAREFSSITAENEMKPEGLQPREGDFRWGAADRFVEFGERNGMKIIGHCLVWHSQTPGWFFRNADGSKADRETLIRRMRDHIHAVVGRYKGRVHGWDVVNEAFDDSGRLHPSPWRDGIGDAFMEFAFRFAHEADPDAELYYNDYNMFSRGKRRGVVQMVRDFKAKGIRIDAVGLQTHAGLTSPAVSEYEATIVALAEAGVAALGGAAMIHAGATVIDSLPHGSFFHATGGAVFMDIRARLRLIPYEAAIGLVSTLAAVGVYLVR